MERQIVVLNVDGSSPSGHPQKETSPKGNVFFISLLFTLVNLAHFR